MAKIPWGVVPGLGPSASTGTDQRHGTSRERPALEQNKYQLYVGIDWGSEQHRVCILSAGGEIRQQKWIEHTGKALAELVDDLRRLRNDMPPERVAVAIEVPRGAIVETLLEHGFQVFFINPKQLDRFRDRYTAAGAKDDERDALVLADALRTDQHCFHSARLDDATIIRLRELARTEEDLAKDEHRAANQLWEQLHRYYPQLLKVCPGAHEPWLWDLLEAAPLPSQGAQLSLQKISSILQAHRIRRLQPAAVQSVVASPALRLAPGAAEAASEHALLLLPRLRLLHEQRAQINRRIAGLLKELTAPGNAQEHRDATILLSLPGVGRKVAVTMLCEASQAIAERDYHALRCYGGTAPVTRRSGKKQVVVMRYACSEYLRNALYHWARTSSIFDERSKRQYQQMRRAGHTHARALRGIADRWLPVAMAMLRTRTLFDPSKRSVIAA